MQKSHGVPRGQTSQSVCPIACAVGQLATTSLAGGTAGGGGYVARVALPSTQARLTPWARDPVEVYRALGLSRRRQVRATGAARDAGDRLAALNAAPEISGATGVLGDLQTRNVTGCCAARAVGAPTEVLHVRASLSFLPDFGPRRDAYAALGYALSAFPRSFSVHFFCGGVITALLLEVGRGEIVALSPWRRQSTGQLQLTRVRAIRRAQINHHISTATHRWCGPQLFARPCGGRFGSSLCAVGTLSLLRRCKCLLHTREICRSRLRQTVCEAAIGRTGAIADGAPSKVRRLPDVGDRSTSLLDPQTPLAPFDLLSVQGTSTAFVSPPPSSPLPSRLHFPQLGVF
jgi:hypothetical protein